MMYYMNFNVHPNDMPAAAVDWLVSLLLEVIPLAAAEQRGRQEEWDRWYREPDPCPSY